MALYLYEGDGEVTGPHSADSVAARIQSGDLAPDSLGAREGTDDWQPLHKLVKLPAPQAVRKKTPPAISRPKPGAQEQPAIDPAGGPGRITDLARLRQHTVYPFIRMLANVIMVLGILSAAVQLFVGFAGRGEQFSIMFAASALVTAASALLFREAVHLGADIADRLHQAGQR